jgi:hypothetical protein
MFSLETKSSFRLQWLQAHRRCVWVAIPLLLGALGCIYLHLVRELFMLFVFTCCTDCF